MPEAQPSRATLARPRGRGRREPLDFAAAVRDVLRIFAVQDLILLAYLGAVTVALLATARGHERETEVCLRRVAFDVALLSVAAYAARVAEGFGDRARAVIYRAGLVSVLVDSYLMLRDLLPLVRADSVDATLLSLDLRLFGVEPALWLERFNRPGVIEWFAFFYFSYFFVAFIYMAGVIWLRRTDRATTELAIGVLLVFCIGQLGYMAVPGFGPVRHLAGAFHAPIDGGFFWSCVQRTVAAGGANKDVFPSLHTAAPTFFAIFAWRRASADRRWRVAAVITTFFAANIVISTMMLRWHYAVDVVAGLCLATFAGLAAPRIAAAEEGLRRRLGVPSTWAFGVEKRPRDCGGRTALL